LLDILHRRPADIYVTVIRQNNQVVVGASDPKAMEQIL
jgi:hypothetical protein